MPAPTTTTGPTLDEPACWRAVLARDASRDGSFVYAVRSTGVFCRPSCPARRPRPENVAYFPDPGAAERAGFRACRRCRPGQADTRTALVEAVCRRLEQAGSAPTLAALGREFGLSPAYLQRTFKAALGISPGQYARGRRLEALKAELRAGKSVTASALAAGYNSTGRLQADARRLGMTPSAFGKGAPGERVVYGIAPCPVGLVLVAETDRGVCAIELGDDPETLAAELARDFPRAERVRDDRAVGHRVAAILELIAGDRTTRDPGLPLDLRATAFQRRVWDHLAAIPRGQTRSYRAVAEALGHPKAARAVARACATNLVSLAIPCHRVVRGDGSLGGYRWGLDRKRALLDRERDTAEPE